MTLPTEFEQRWADWRSKGRRHDLTLRRRVRWVAAIVGTGLFLGFVWVIT